MNEATANLTLSVPTLADWQSEPWCLDARAAFDHLYGKTTEEAVRLFEENAIHYSGDLLFMPSRTFGYYLRAYMVFLESGATDSDALSFFGLVEHKLQFQPDALHPLWPEIAHLLKRLSTEHALRDFDPKFGRRFPRRVERILARAAKAFAATERT